MQKSGISENKINESIRIKNQAKMFAEKLAIIKAREVFTERVMPTTMFTDNKKQKFIEKIAKQYEPIFYKDIINKIISQKVIEAQTKKAKLFYLEKNKKSQLNQSTKTVPVSSHSHPQYESNHTEMVSQNNNVKQEEDIARAIINSSREVYDMLNTNNQNLENNDSPSSILPEEDDDQDEKLVMSILTKKNGL